MVASFVEQLQQLCNKYHVNAKDLANRLTVESKKTKEEKSKEKAQKHKDLVGKCYIYETKPRYGTFPKIKRYLKVISYKSLNENRVECLVFDEFPSYWFNYQTRSSDGIVDDFFGSFDFNSFEVSSYLVSSVEKMKEISLQEYNEALFNFSKTLSEMKWCTNHSRAGGKIPIDEDWSKKDDM